MQAGDLFDGQFDTQISARHHDAVADFEDLVDIFHRPRLFHFRHHPGAAVDDLARVHDVHRALHKRQRHPVDPQRQRKLQILYVLRRQRRQRQDRVGQVDALVRGQRPADPDHRVGAAFFDPDHLQMDTAIVEQQRHARLERGEYFLMRQGRPAGVALGFGKVEAERRALFQNRALGHLADTQLRSLQIDEDADGPAQLCFDVANRLVPCRHIVVAAMAHIEPEHVGAGFEQLADHLRRAAGRAQGRQYLYVAGSPHGKSAFFSPVAVSK